MIRVERGAVLRVVDTVILRVNLSLLARFPLN